MEPSSVTRRLAAIVIADVVGYTRLMERDDAGTLARLREIREELLDPKITEFGGHVVRMVGDGMLLEFGSADAALRCAVDVQRAMAQRNAPLAVDDRIQYRIGINIGDIIVDGNDIAGDGVNLAARLEALAEPGEICVSAAVREQVHGALDVGFDDIGEQQVRNIARPIRIYRLRLTSPTGQVTPTLPLPDKPSIAVLPFQNMSGDPDQEYFTDGVVEDIITALSRIRWLFVIARNSSFTYKGRSVNVKQIGRELGVRYLVSGSVRKAVDRVRIAAQLIDTSTGAHLWADQFDEALVDIFDLQDKVTAGVVGPIAPKVEEAEIERARRKPTESLDAYDCYLRGMASFHRAHKHGATKEVIGEALRLFYRAIHLDPEFASAHGMAALCYSMRKVNGWVTQVPQEVAEATQLARRAAELGADDAVALATGGYALAHVGGDLDHGAAMIDRARTLNPNLAIAWLRSGFVRCYLGQPEVAIEHLSRAMRLSPLDPTLFLAHNGMAFAHFVAGRYDDTAAWAERTLREQPNWAGAARLCAASHALAGRLEAAQKAMQRVRELAPALRVSNLKDVLPLRRAEDFDRYVEGLRKAGLPE